MSPLSKGIATRGQTVGLGILSWRGDESLGGTLQSHKEADLLSILDEALVLLPDPDEAVIAAAQD